MSAVIAKKEGFKCAVIESAQANLNAANAAGRRCCVTCAYSGLGVETTKTLLAMKAKVVVRFFSVNGAYYMNCEVAQESENDKNEENRRALYYQCNKITRKFQ